MDQHTLNEQQLDEYLQENFRFVDISEVDQDMSIQTIFKEGSYVSCEAEWDSTNEVEDFSTQLFVELHVDFNVRQSEEYKTLLDSGRIRVHFMFPIKEENATVQVGRIVERLIKEGYPEDLQEITRILSQLEEEAQDRVLDTIVVHVSGGIVQSVSSDRKQKVVILDSDTDGVDEEDITVVDGKAYYKYEGITESDVQEEYVSSLKSQFGL